MIDCLICNADYLVAVKPPELCSEDTPDGRGFCNLLRAEYPGFLAPVYRLDRGVGGVMLYARNPEAAAFFSALVQNHALEKEYLAVLGGVPAEPEGELRDLLYYSRSGNKSYVVKRKRVGVKEAALSYRVLGMWEDGAGDLRSAVSVHPLTGRTHQIRVQFASRGLPLVGDRRYGGAADPAWRWISLWCRLIRLPAYHGHPAASAAYDCPFWKGDDEDVDR